MYDSDFIITDRTIIYGYTRVYYTIKIIKNDGCLLCNGLLGIEYKYWAQNWTSII